MTSVPSSGAPATRPPWLDELLRRLPADRVSTRPEDLLCYSRDMWARSLLAVASGQPPGPPPAAVVWPRDVGEIETIVRLCREQRVPVVPFGAGSGVTGGAVPAEGGLVVDLKRMRRLHIDPARMEVRFEPGLLGWHLEDALAARNLTLGHFPSSIMCSTVGGWVATRGAGQMSTKYGKIEDMVRALTVVTGDGRRRHLDSGEHGGFDLVQAMTGSEGTLGFITEATCAVRRAPAQRAMRGYWFPDVDSGLHGIRHLLQRGLRPAVVRLYDEIDTLIAGMGRGHVRSHGSGQRDLGHDLGSTAGRLLHLLSSRVGKIDLGAPGRPPLDLEELVELLKPDARRAAGLLERWATQLLASTATPVNRLLDALLPRFHVGCVLILGCEGEPSLAEAEAEYARQELVALGARDLGEEPGERWLRKRYDVSFKQPKMYAAGALVDTIEVAATWDRLPLLHSLVRAAIGQHALVMAHFSHAYADGCSIYFSFVMRAPSLDGYAARGGGHAPDRPSTAAEQLAKLDADRRRYDSLWRAAMGAAVRAGGTISHHHGVGRLRAPFMAAEHGESVRLLSALKRAADPDGILNPGKLLPPEALRQASPDSQPEPMTDASPGTKASGERIGPVQPDALLIEVEAGARLWKVEQALRRIGLSLGGLPARAYLRTLGEAFTAPRPSEACLDMGRLRDRRARLVVLLRGGRRLTVPPQPVPRRAAGPDLGALLIGGGVEGAELFGATLRVQRRPQPPSWNGLLFDDAAAAVRALHEARTLHGSTALQEIVLLKRPLLRELLSTDALPTGEYALLVSAGGPVAEAALRELHGRLRGLSSATDPKPEALPDEAAARVWLPEALFADEVTGEPGASSTTSQRIANHAARFPAHEQPLGGTPAEQAALLARLPPAALLCGVHLHGLTVFSPEPLPTARDGAEGDDGAPLWSVQTLLSAIAPPTDEGLHV